MPRPSVKHGAAVLCLIFLLGSCATEPSEVVSETASNLEKLRSGILELRVRVSPAPGDEAEPQEAGFELTGSFQLPEEGQLPVADLEYTDLGAEEPTTQGFVSTGTAAFIEVEGQAYELPPEQAQALVGGGGEGELFAQASVEEWLREPVLHEGEGLDGAEVDRVTGELDVVAALNDLFAIAQSFGGGAGFQTIEGDEAERLENAVGSSHIEIVTGAEDRLLRRLLIEAELALDESLELTELLGPLSGASFSLDMSISEPNQPIQVSEPPDALPIEELSSEG